MNEQEDKDKNNNQKQEENVKDNESNICALTFEEELKKKKDAYDVLWDKYVRLCAEFDNARKRWEREKNDFVKFANFYLLKELLVIVDEMEQALKIIKDHRNVDEIIKGLEMTCNKFMNIFKAKGIKTIETEGKIFDPNLHEIISGQEVDEKDERKIIEVVQKGYFLDDKVLRTSKVIVGIIKKTTNGRQRTADENYQDDDNADVQSS